MRDFTTVAELFATLGLDASPLIKGLEESRIALHDISPDIISVKSLIEQLGLSSNVSAAFVDELKLSLQAMYEQKQAEKLLEKDTHAAEVQAARQDAERMAARVAEEKRLQRESNLAVKTATAQKVANQREELASDKEYAALKNQYAAQVAADEAVAAAEQRRLERESVLASRAMAAQRAAIQKAQAASDAEYIALKNDLAVQQAEADAAIEAEQEAAFAVQMELLERERAARKLAIEEERYQDNVMWEQQRRAAAASSGQFGMGRGVGARGSAVEIQAAAQLTGIEGIHRGLTSVLARIPQVQSAMTAMFGVFAAVAFIEILGSIGTKLGELSDEFRGLDAESTKTWNNASRGVEKTILDLMDLKNKQREVTEAGLKGKELHLTQESNAKQEIDDLKAQIPIHAQLRSELSQTAEFMKHMGTFEDDTYLTAMFPKYEEYKKFKTLAEENIQHYGNLKTAIEAVNVAREREEDLLSKLNLKIGEQTRESEKRDRQAQHSQETRDKARSDRVHELPYRLPWFMSANPAGSFARDIAQARYRNNPDLNYTDFSRSGAPEASIRSAGGDMGRTTAQAGATSVSRGPSNAVAPKSPVSISITITNDFKFDGVPADIQKFTRDVMEPALIADMEKNTRQLTDKMTVILRKAGL